MTNMNESTTALAALKRAKRLCDEVVFKKFNWGASCLDANAITLLNEVPSEIDAAIKQIENNLSINE